VAPKAPGGQHLGLGMPVEAVFFKDIMPSFFGELLKSIKKKNKKSAISYS
jgi:hypothetical protein